MGYILGLDIGVASVGYAIIDENYNVKFHDWNAVKSGLRDELSRLMYERTKRRPMILPILMEI